MLNTLTAVESVYSMKFFNLRFQNVDVTVGGVCNIGVVNNICIVSVKTVSCVF